MKIEGAVCLVTGGAKGLGLAIARHLRDCGGTVVVADRDEAALRGLDDTLSRVVLDVTEPDAARATASEIVERHGSLDVLVNNAGVIYSEPFVNLMNSSGIIHDYGRFRDCVTANLDSVFVMTAAAVEQMVSRRIRGAIINVSSISANGNEGQTAYSAAKAGVNAMTVTWAKELGRWGIRCNAVAPGFIDTDSTRRALSESTLDHVRTSTPLRRLGKGVDVARAVAALVENDFISGAILNVDGGLTI